MPEYKRMTGSKRPSSKLRNVSLLKLISRYTLKKINTDSNILNLLVTYSYFK